MTESIRFSRLILCTAARIDAVARLRDPLEEMLRDLVALAEVPDGHR